MRLVRLLAAVFSLLLATGCESLNVPPPRIAFPWQGIADVAGPSPMLPLAKNQDWLTPAPRHVVKDAWQVSAAE